VFQYDLLVNGIDIGDRWNLPTSGGTIPAGGQQIRNMTAVNVNERGLDPATRTFDLGFEAGTNAALFGRIDFEAIGFGSTDITLSMGQTLIVEGGVVPPLQFVGGTVHVLFVEIPPPLIGDLGPLVADMSLNGPNDPTIVIGTLPASDDEPIILLNWMFDGAPSGPGTPAIAPTLDPATGLFSWDVNGSKAGLYEFRIRATDRHGLSDSGILSVIVVIPEPASFRLACLSLVGLTAFARRR
jgi:hypothetical protein